MTGTADPPRAFPALRLVSYLPYALVAGGIGWAPTQALMLAWVLTLAFPGGARALTTTAAHLSLWALLLALLPDPFPLWQAPVLSLLLGATMPRWQPRPRWAALGIVLLGLPALVDMLVRLQPEAEVAASAARNPWVGRPALDDHGRLLTLERGAEASPLAIVLPQRFTPWPLHADQASRIRGAALVGGGILLALLLHRRRHWTQVSLVLPVLLAWALTRPPAEIRIWVADSAEGWWLLTCDQDLLDALRAGHEDAVALTRPAQGAAWPTDPVAWAQRGALVAPTEGGEEAYRELLSHWADATLPPTLRATTSASALATSRRWEIDAGGHILLRPLP